MLGIQSIRGSRHFRGAEALRSMLAELKAGHDVAVTPDGSRGPCYEMKPGGLLLARTARSPVLLISSKVRPCLAVKILGPVFFTDAIQLCGVTLRADS